MSYDLLFEPVRIGPVTAPNRFFAAPHATGHGFSLPAGSTALRAMKAEGGWGTVAVQITEVSQDSDMANHPIERIWDDVYLDQHAKQVDAIKAHGALAAIELAHGGMRARNFATGVPVIGPSDLPILRPEMPVQARAMDKSDIREFRRAHKKAAQNAKDVGYDILYVYAAHDISLLSHFLSRRTNFRSDEYGGCLENRARLLREVLEETKDAVGDRCAVAIRLAVDELQGPEGISCEGEGREIVELLAELPDLWDVNISDWENDSVSSRFEEEGWQERYVAFVKQITSKPVVGVGRFTSPDTMVSQIKRGVLDMIGAARPSIADPFLPEKIEQGRLDEIRECIGCNICVSGQHTFTPMRCTQNPSVGEEWRRGWHPERIAPKGSDATVLVVGAGPAGLEAARALGQRGYAVTLAEAGEELGGRVTHESRLPGLSAWARVRDWRVGRIQEMTNVDVFLGSRLSVEDVLEYGFSHVVVATGAHWRADGVGVSNWQPIQGSDQAHVLTPEHIYAGVAIADPVLVFDDDNFYLGAVIAEKLTGDGHAVTLVTTDSKVSSWTENTLEQHRIQARVLELGIEVVTAHTIAQIHADKVECTCIFTNHLRTVTARSVVMVTSRQPNNQIYLALRENPEKLASAGIRSVSAIGDCNNPSTIATAIYEGHRVARELDAAPVDPDMPFRREQIALASSV